VAVLTSKEAAAVRGSLLSQGAKAMMVRSKGVFYLLVMSAVRHIDMKKVKNELRTKSLSLASEQEVNSLTGCLKGGVPPFGSLWGIKTYMDTSLRSEKEIEFNAGLRTKSLHMLQADYEAFEQPILVDITQEIDTSSRND